METVRYLYMTCPKCGGKIKIKAPARACQMIFACPHCKSKLKLVYGGDQNQD